jgi:Flp pilus assembly protein TadB
MLGRSCYRTGSPPSNLQAMSKERARKRAEERARKRAPRSRDAASVGASESNAPAHGGKHPPGARAGKKPRQRTAREKRHRRRIWIIAVTWVVANVGIVAIARSWEALWIGLTVTTILVPLIVWLVWDPEGRVGL